MTNRGDADGTTADDKADDAVAPEGTHTYQWLVPERSGPGPHDESSVVWMYHSHTDLVTDTYSGAVGAIVITAKGKAVSSLTDLRPLGVDREFVLFFGVINEGDSTFGSFFAVSQNIQNIINPQITKFTKKLKNAKYEL